MSIMPPHDKNGVIVGMTQIDKQPRYVVSYADMPHLRISVKPQNILRWVSQPSYGNWKQSQLRDERLQEDALAKVGASDGRHIMKDKMLAGQEEGKLGKKRRRSLAVENVVNVTTMAPSSVPGGKNTSVLDSETEEEGDTLATDAALDRQLNGSLTNPLSVRHSQSTTSPESKTSPKAKKTLLTAPGRQTKTSSTSASASTTVRYEAKRRRTYGHGGPHKNLVEATSVTKLASRTNDSSVRKRSRPSPTRISPGAHTKCLQTTTQRTTSTSSTPKQSATLPAPADEEDDESEWEVDEILEHELRKEGRGKPHLYYCIRWAGDWDDSWEPQENVGSGVVAEYWQKKRRETERMNLDKAVSRESNDDPMHVDVNINGGGNMTRHGLDDGYESDKDSLFVGQGLSSRGNGIGNAKGNEVEFSAARSLMMMRTTKAQSVDGV
ncbi:hypothetical protein DL95DRAFT_397977 [Leptodontidium sp. 2 PMI_412]|nr:hypothetical protein DL95DRAFT_397977 [Leptodontidium sp. 2 PMI_412]